MAEDLQETDHGLDAADETLVKAILKRGKRHDENCQHTLPVGPERIVILARHLSYADVSFQKAEASKRL